ncbi:MAG: glycosyltransferase family 10 [Desulfuromonadales bacterium]
MDKTVKRIAVTDGPPAFVESILEFVKDRYDFEITEDIHADYVFYSVDGYDVLRYPGVRIFVTGENVTPNFAIADYAMGFERLDFGDRYIWMPLIKLYRDAYAVLTRPRRPVAEVLPDKTDFCAYVMSNIRDSAPERVTLFEELSGYKEVHSGGRWRNNVGGPVHDKQAFQARHKFVLAIENCSSPGYLTEKFAQAAQADAIPIYWGDPEIGRLFNPKAFINCHDFNSLAEVVEYVKKVDQNDDLYRTMLREPWFPDSKEPECLKDENFRAFLVNIFNQKPSAAYRRNQSRWGIKTEQRLYNMYHRPHIHGFNLMRKACRDFLHTLKPKGKNH